jgi:hypothetical protein
MVSEAEAEAEAEADGRLEAEGRLGAEDGPGEAPLLFAQPAKTSTTRHNVARRRVRMMVGRYPIGAGS